MSGELKSPTPSELAETLRRLDEVMAEAARLRSEVTHQLATVRRRQQQSLAPKGDAIARRTRKRR